MRSTSELMVMAFEAASVTLLSWVLSTKGASSSPVTLTWEISYFVGLDMSISSYLIFLIYHA